MARFLNCTLLLVSLLASSVSNVFGSNDVTSIVTAGPAECEPIDRLTVGRYAKVFYTGSIDESSETGEKGFVFESNVGYETYEFPISQNKVLLGWDHGLNGKCVGSNVTLILPPEYAYGDEGAHGVIPGGATLRFDIEIMSVANRPNPPNVFLEIDTNRDGYCDRVELTKYFSAKGIEQIPRRIFQIDDRNRDGKISWDEFVGPKGDTPPKYDEL